MLPTSAVALLTGPSSLGAESWKQEGKNTPVFQKGVPEPAHISCSHTTGNFTFALTSSCVLATSAHQEVFTHMFLQKHGGEKGWVEEYDRDTKGRAVESQHERK